MAINNSTRVQLKFLSLISNVYSFEHLKPIHPMMANIGVKTIVSVVFSINSFPEIGLADSLNSDNIEYYSFQDLLIFPA